MNKPNFSELVPSVLDVKATADFHISEEELNLPESKTIAELLDETKETEEIQNNQ